VSPCFRLNLVQQTLSLIEYLNHTNIFHCDWKYDQTTVDIEGKLKVVDLKSLYEYPSPNTTYKGDVTCTENSECKKCFKMMELPIEQSCNKDTGHCQGFDARSLVFATAKSFWPTVFPEMLREQIPAPTRFWSLWDSMILAATSDSPADRPRIRRLQANVDTLIHLLQCDKLQVNIKLSDTDRNCLQSALKLMLQSSSERCSQGRYC